MNLVTLWISVCCLANGFRGKMYGIEEKSAAQSSSSSVGSLKTHVIYMLLRAAWQQPVQSIGNINPPIHEGLWSPEGNKYMQHWVLFITSVWRLFSILYACIAFEHSGLHQVFHYDFSLR